MNQKSTCIAIGVGALLVALFLLGQPGGGPVGGSTVSAGSSALAAVESSFDFGSISMAAGKVQHGFTIKNSGPVNATITSLYTSCMCTSATIIKGDERLGPFGMQGHGFIPRIHLTLAPGEEAQVFATFDPAAHGPAGVGTIARTIYVEEDGSAPLELGISATVTP